MSDSNLEQKQKNGQNLDDCYWGAYCGHAVLTEKLGVYHCPFKGQCFKRSTPAEDLNVSKTEKATQHD